MLLGTGALPLDSTHGQVWRHARLWAPCCKYPEARTCGSRQGAPTKTAAGTRRGRQRSAKTITRTRAKSCCACHSGMETRCHAPALLFIREIHPVSLRAPSMPRNLCAFLWPTETRSSCWDGALTCVMLTAATGLSFGLWHLSFCHDPSGPGYALSKRPRYPRRINFGRWSVDQSGSQVRGQAADHLHAILR